MNNSEQPTQSSPEEEQRAEEMMTPEEKSSSGDRIAELIKNKEQEIKEKKKQEYIALAQELSESHESLPFPGVNPESYSKLKAAAEEYPEYTTPIDELLEKFRSQGIKVVFGNHPESGNVFILPADSEDVAMDNLFPRHLTITEDMDERLKKLILAGKELAN
ncbi:MAG: hypothetical protein AAB389_00800 [Patescibacteria group bacterium]